MPAGVESCFPLENEARNSIVTIGQTMLEAELFPKLKSYLVAALTCLYRDQLARHLLIPRCMIDCLQCNECSAGAETGFIRKLPLNLQS